MFDYEIVMSSLTKICKAIDTIIERTSAVDNLEDLLHSQNGMMVIDAICMNLIALGEAVKGLDKQTHGDLFPNYPEIHWSGVMRMRDKIANHYFDIDTDVVFRTVQEDIPKMKIVIDKIIEDIKSKMSDV